MHAELKAYCLELKREANKEDIKPQYHTLPERKTDTDTPLSREQMT